MRLASLCFLVVGSVTAFAAQGQGAPDRVSMLAVALPAVVSVKVEENGTRATPSGLEWLVGDRPPTGRGRALTSAGSGFVVDAGAGLIVTADFVVANAKRIEVVLEGGKVVPATVVATDEDTQLGLLRVAPDALRGIQPLPWGDSSSLRVGEPVVLAGFPFQFGKLASQGMVSGMQRMAEDGREYLVTDARIMPGHAGGPLLDARGRVVGVAVAIYGAQANATSIGITVPQGVAQPVIEQLKSGPIVRGSLGIQVAPAGAELELAEGLPSGPVAPPGARIASVAPGSGAAVAGVLPDDVITAVDGAAISTMGDLMLQVRRKPVGAAVQLSVWRKGKQLVLPVILGPRQP